MGKKASNPRPPAKAVKPDPPPAPADFVGWEASSDWPDGASPPPMPPVKPAVAPYPTVVVHFDGHEDLCRRLMAEAAKCGETVGQHLLWLAGVYVQGLDR